MALAFDDHLRFRANPVNWAPSSSQLELGIEIKDSGSDLRILFLFLLLESLNSRSEEKERKLINWSTTFYSTISPLFYRTIDRQALRSLSSSAKHLPRFSETWSSCCQGIRCPHPSKKRSIWQAFRSNHPSGSKNYDFELMNMAFELPSSSSYILAVFSLAVGCGNCEDNWKYENSRRYWAYVLRRIGDSGADGDAYLHYAPLLEVKLGLN